MITLIASLTLSLAASASPFRALKEMLHNDPARGPIAPCEEDWSCVQVGKMKIQMDQVGLKRDGYEIVGVAKPGQAGLLLVRSFRDQYEQLTLMMKDGGQVYAFNPVVDSRTRPGVPAATLQCLRSAELRQLFEARTEDQLRLRADLVAEQIQMNNLILEMDLESLFGHGLVPQEINSRLNVMSLAILRKSGGTSSLDGRTRQQLKALRRKVMADLQNCGFAQTCAGAT